MGLLYFVQGMFFEPCAKHRAWCCEGPRDEPWFAATAQAHSRVGTGWHGLWEEQPDTVITHSSVSLYRSDSKG